MSVKSNENLDAGQSMISRLSVTFCTYLFWLLYCVVPNAHAQNDPPELNQPFSLSRNLNQANPGFVTTTDNLYTVFRVGATRSRQGELFSNRLAGGTPIRLHPALVRGERWVPTFRVTSDNQSVVFVVNNIVDNTGSVHSTDILGQDSKVIAGPFPLSSSIIANGNVGITVSPDSQRVVIFAIDPNSGTREVFSVPLGGGNLVKLNTPLATGSFINNVMITADSQYVLYPIFSITTPSLRAIRRVPIAGGTNVVVSGSFNVLTENVNFIQFVDPNSERFIHAVQPIGGVGASKIISAPITAGAAPVQISHTLGADETITINGNPPFANNRVVYNVRDQRSRLIEIWTAPLNGDVATPPIKISVDLTSDQEIRLLQQLSLDKDHFFYTVRTRDSVNNLTTEQLYVSDLTNNGSTQIASTDNLETTSSSSFKESPDGSSIVFAAQKRVIQPTPQNSFRIIKANIDGSGQIDLLPSQMRTVSGVTSIGISHDSSEVFFNAELDTVGFVEIYRTPLQGGPVSKINPDFPDGSNTSNEFELSEDGFYLLYTAPQNSATTELIGVLLRPDPPLAPPQPDEDFCFPVVARNANIALVCL